MLLSKNAINDFINKMTAEESTPALSGNAAANRSSDTGELWSVCSGLSASRCTLKGGNVQRLIFSQLSALPWNALRACLLSQRSHGWAHSGPR